MSFKYSKPPAKKIVKVARQCIKLNKHRPTRSNTNQTLCEGTGNLTERVIFKDNKVRQSRSFEVNEIRQEIRRFKRINVEMNKRRIATSRGPETSRTPRNRALSSEDPARVGAVRKKLDALSVPLKDEHFDLVDEEVLAISHCCKLGGD